MSDDSGPRRGWGWLSSVSVASRLAATIVAVSVVSLGVATLVGLQTGRSLNDDLVDDQLLALRTAAATDVASQMAFWATAAGSLGSSPATPETVERFVAAYNELPVPSSIELDEQVEVLSNNYRGRFIEPFESVGINVDLREIVPSDTASITLQHAYAIPGDPRSLASDLDDARDDSAWSAIHKEVHPIYRDLVERLELVDVLLVEPSDGNIVYSVAKQPDLGTSLNVGPFSGSVIAKAFDTVVDDPSGGTVITDISEYTPAGLAPVGAIASPVVRDDTLVGVVVFIYNSEELTKILTSDGQWESAGFPETGETFLVGADGTLRSDPRAYIENSTEFLDAATAAGTLSEPDRDIVQAANTAVLRAQANDETANAVLEGQTTVHGRSSVTGASVVSTAVQLSINRGPEWIVVTEVGASIADGSLADFAQLLIVGASIFVILVAFAAVGWSTSILAPIREMSRRLGAGERSADGIVVPERSPVEFRQLHTSFEDMMEALDRQRTELVGARERRIELLREMLPPGVAQRLSNGDLESLEEVPKASVVVVVIAGLASLVRPLDDGAERVGGSNRDIVDRLHGELDQIGQRHGVERIKIVGDAFYAACGHNRPYVDHAPRIVAFAADAQDSVRELGAEVQVDLDVVAGAHTGPVTVGMTLESRLVYDVWGTTVSTAHNLARRGQRGEIIVTRAMQELLPGSIRTEPVDGADDFFRVETLSVGGRT